MSLHRRVALPNQGRLAGDGRQVRAGHFERAIS